MAVVTKLEVQKRNKKRVIVYVDDEYAFSLSPDEAARLSKGQVVSDLEIAALINQSAVGLAVDRALRLLTLRPRSVVEIKQNLARNAVAPPVIDATIERLQYLGYLDDQVFASFWVDGRQRSKPTSPRALRYELMQKGVDKTVIDSILADLDADETAYRAALRQNRKLRGSTKRVYRDRLSAFLQRRGFSYSVARKTIQRLIDELEADAPDFFADEDSAAHFDDD
jgi:regulatory protein